MLGFLVAAPIAALLWFAAAFTWLALSDGLTAAAADVPVLVIGGLLLGLPAAALAVILFAGPLYALLLLLDRVRFAHVFAGGAFVGFITAALVDLLIESGFILPPALGALIGAATAACWWCIARPDGSAHDTHAAGEDGGTNRVSSSANPPSIT